MNQANNYLTEYKSASKSKSGLASSQFTDSNEILDNALQTINDVDDNLKLNFKNGGWAEDEHRSARSRGRINLIEEERFKDKGYTEFDNNDDDIPVIPNIDDIQEDIISSKEAKQPTILIDRSTYKELDTEVSPVQGKSLELRSFTKTNIDLYQLTKKLYSQKQVKEPDEEWTMESLYNDILVNTST